MSWIWAAKGSCLSSLQTLFNIISFYEFTFPPLKRSVPIFADKTNRSAFKYFYYLKVHKSVGLKLSARWENPEMEPHLSPGEEFARSGVRMLSEGGGSAQKWAALRPTHDPPPP